MLIKKLLIIKQFIFNCFRVHFLEMASPDLACVYAALILKDDNIEITNEKIQNILKAAGVKVESYWIDLFSEYFKTHDLTELIKGTSLGNNSSNAVQTDQNQAVANEENNEDKKEEEEVEIEGGFDDLFN